MVKNWHSIMLFMVMVFISTTYSLAQEQKTYSLKEALQMARANNPDLQSERLNIDMAQSDIISAKIRPNLTFSHETVQMTNSSDFENSAGWYRGGNREELWEVSKPLQIAGQRRHKIDYANKSLELEEQNYFETERNLFEEVATQWLEVWAAQKHLHIIEAAKSQGDSILLINETRYRNQVITQTDLMRTKLMVKQYSLEHKTAVQEVINEQNKLKFLLGSTEEVKIDMDEEFFFPIPQNFDALLKEASNNRGDIQAAKTYSDVSDSNIKLQKSLAYPQPEVGVIYNPQNSVPHVGFSASIDLPFFDRNQGERQKSQIQKDQADRAFTTLQSKVENEITIAAATYQLKKDNLADFEMLLEQSETILENVRYAYIKGGTTILDFLEAQNSWLEMQQQYYEVLQDYRQSYIQLLHATGLINQLAL